MSRKFIFTPPSLCLKLQFNPSRWSAVFLALLFIAAGNVRISAQAVFGSIVGTVTDPTGAVIPGATVIVTDVGKGTSQTVQSNASGNYTVFRLIPDTYTVKATAQGFSPAETDNVIVSAGGTPQVNLVFQPEGSTQNITVTGAAPALQTDNAAVSTVLSQRQFQDLPNQNRNFSTFGLLVPGVSEPPSISRPQKIHRERRHLRSMVLTMVPSDICSTEQTTANPWMASSS